MRIIYIVCKFIILLKIIFFLSKSFFTKEYLLKNNGNSIILISKGFELKTKNINFNVCQIKYLYSFKFNMVEIEFNIQFFDNNKNLIIPSNLALYYNFQIICVFKNTINNYVNSLANIYKNKYFNCKEYFNLKEKIKLGIIIYKKKEEFKYLSFFNFKIINYKSNLNIDDNKFNPFYLYFKKVDIINNSLSLKNFYLSSPNFSKKNDIAKSKNSWYFKNIFNNYFCFCYGKKCNYQNIPQECKYKFYLYIIDLNKLLYKKTDYLLADFLFEDRAPGDAYILFKEMLKKNFTVHYLTERKDIYNEYFNENKELLRIIPIYNKEYNITGDTIEKYLNLFLRIKVVISGAEFYSIYNIFYNIEYITFICLGHGVNYFKSFLYNDYYGAKRYNKIILPSETIIKIAKKYGWSEDNIIKVGLPKWDLFDNYTSNIKSFSNEKIKLINKSIFMMFTWRSLRKGKEISPYYFNNILKLLNDIKLNKILENKNIYMHASVHHNLLSKQDLIKVNKNIKYVRQEEILECLTNSSLIISDFSSVIFDIIYQNKPFILYIPDSDDPNIKELYSEEYFEIINNLKNGSIFFENKFFNIEDTIQKIIYYINNNFKIENKLKRFYKYFKFKGKNHINTLINYLKILN